MLVRQHKSYAAVGAQAAWHWACLAACNSTVLGQMVGVAGSGLAGLCAEAVVCTVSRVGLPVVL
jgi:hypothetical protein